MDYFDEGLKPDEIRMPQGTNHKNQRVGGPDAVQSKADIMYHWQKMPASLASVGWLHGNWLHCPLIFDFSKTSTENNINKHRLKT